MAGPAPRLKAFVPLMDSDESVKRELLMTPSLLDWCKQQDSTRSASYKPNVRAFLGRFVKGGEVDNENYMKTWRDDVWELRAQFEPRAPSKPHYDNTRIFGAFARIDTFIAFHPPRFRSYFGGADDPRWNARINDVVEQWTALFGNIGRVPSVPFSNCLSKNFIDWANEGREMTAKSVREIPKEDLAELWFSFNHSVLEQLQATARKLKKKGVTQEVIAERLGIGPAVVSRRLRGRSNMSMRTMHDLARAMNSRLRVAVEDLGSLTPSNNNPGPWQPPPTPNPRQDSGSASDAKLKRIRFGG